ncbi:MAG TPA: hypothetical protein VGR07_02045 [Thermoanaerobaculia bacterium]|jgi:hypothetical protein|nr:hypothetical protein [Thermoanaerobaculia bacterium]
MEIPHIRPDKSEKAPDAARARGRVRGGPVLATLRHRWPEYLIEMVVIILSISISFALDQWKERRHEHEVEQLYLKTLSNNLISDTDALHDVIPETQLVIRKAQALFAASQAPPSAAAPSGPFDEDLRDIARRPSFFAHDAAFADLRSSGNLRVIHDFRLKNALFDYYGQYESIKAKEASERESLITLIAPNLIKMISLSGGAPSPGEPGRAALPHDRVFANSMWIRIHERSEMLEDYKRELALAERIRERIKRDLD